jgi:hypothetical protein
MLPELQGIINELPALREQIRNLFEHDRDFRTLCKDHLTCINSLRHWEMRALDDARMINEYMSIKGQLESDVIEYLNKSINMSKDGR